MVIVKKEKYKTNRNKKAKTKICKKVVGRDNNGGKKTWKGKKNREESTGSKRFRRDSKNGRNSAASRKTRESKKKRSISASYKRSEEEKRYRKANASNSFIIILVWLLASSCSDSCLF